MSAYLQAVWGCRYFWLSLVKVDLRARYRGSVLGLGWSLLHPLAMTAIFTVVFCGFLKQEPRYYMPFVLIGMALWSFLLQTTIGGCDSFFRAESYIRQHPAPLAIYPLRHVLGMMFHFLAALALGLAFSAASWGTVRLAPLLALPLILLLVLLLGWSLAILGGLATVLFRDTRQLLDIAFQILFYMTPIFYNVEMFRGSVVGEWLRFNPVLPFLDLLRLVLLEGVLPPAHLFLKAAVIVAAAGALAACALARLEKRLIFHL